MKSPVGALAEPTGPFVGAGESGLAAVSKHLARTQGKPIAWGLMAAAAVFGMLCVQNLMAGDLVLAGLCMIALTFALVFSHSFYFARPAPVSDAVLAFTGLGVLAVTIEARGLTGVLWCHPLILMFHLVTGRRSANAFNLGAILLAVPLTYLRYDAVTAFRVAVILLVGSAFAKVYGHIVGAQQDRQEEQRRQLDLLIKCSNVGSLEWSAKTGETAYSTRLKEMLGFAADADTRGWDFRQMIHPADRDMARGRFIELIKAPNFAGDVQHAPAFDFRLQRQDGHEVWVHAEAIAVGAGAHRSQQFVASFLDMTQILSAEESTRTALEKQRELNELRSRFVAMTSHEFRTPLASILSSAELLKDYGERLPVSEKEEIIQTIETGVNRMARMLERVLLIGKVDARMLEFRPSDVDLAQFSRMLVAEAAQEAPQSPCHLVSEVEAGLVAAVFDERLLRHVLGNLLSNAIKYSPNGGEVRLKVFSAAQKTVFEVSDEGIGIPAEDRAHLFDAFHRASNVGDISGTGLGLAIVKDCVTLHGGEIEVRSELGRGTVFTVTL